MRSPCLRIVSHLPHLSVLFAGSLDACWTRCRDLTPNSQWAASSERHTPESVLCGWTYTGWSRRTAVFTIFFQARSGHGEISGEGEGEWQGREESTIWTQRRTKQYTGLKVVCLVRLTQLWRKKVANKGGGPYL